MPNGKRYCLKIFMKCPGMQLQKDRSLVNIGMQILKEHITVQLAETYYFAQKPNFQAPVAGQAFLNRKTKTVLYIKQILHWEWKGLKYYAEDAADI